MTVEIKLFDRVEGFKQAAMVSWVESDVIGDLIASVIDHNASKLSLEKQIKVNLVVTPDKR